MTAVRLRDQLDAKLADWRAARLAFRVHFRSCPLCFEGPWCPERLRLERATDHAEALLPYHAVRMARPVWTDEYEAEDAAADRIEAVRFRWVVLAFFIGVALMCAWPFLLAIYGGIHR